MSLQSKQVSLAGYLFDLVVDIEEDVTAVFVEKLEPIPPRQSDTQLSLFGPLPK